MTAGRLDNLDLMAPPIVKTIQQRSFIIGVIFAVISVIGAFLRPEEFFRGYLVGYMAWLGVGLGSMAILMLRHLTKGGWGMIIRRILGAAMRTLPLMAALFVPLLFGIKHLYIWSQPLSSVSDKHLRDHLQEISHSYLNVQGYVLRAVVYFAVWGTLIYLLSKWSRQQDQPPVRDNSARF